MPTFTIIIGVLLILVGIGGYVATGMQSATALIPAAIGVIIAICGAVARSERWRMHAMHAAVLFAALGVIGVVMPIVRTIGAGEIARPGAFVSQLLTAALLLVLIGRGIKSFVDARRSS